MMRKRSEMVGGGSRVPAEEQEAAEQSAGEEAFAAAAGDEGQRVEVTWGDELFQPVKFNGMRVGPFTASTLVRRGESVAHATVRLHREIQKAAQLIFAENSLSEGQRRDFRLAVGSGLGWAAWIVGRSGDEPAPTASSAAPQGSSVSAGAPSPTPPSQDGSSGVAAPSTSGAAPSEA